GVILNANINSVNFRWRNIQSYFNGLYCSNGGEPGICTGLHTPSYCCSGPGTATCSTCFGVGFEPSGDDNTTGRQVSNYVTGAVFWRNLQWGTGVYGGGRLDIWNATYFGNGWNNGGNDIMYDESGTAMQLHNSIFPRQSFNSTFHSGNASTPF